MKKINVLTLASVILFGINNLKAQGGDKKEESENCVGKGKFIIDAFYGYPYMVGKYINTAVSSSGESINVTNLNHVGGKVEYMINNVIGLGMECTYASVTAKYANTYSVYNNSTGQYDYQYNNYMIGINKLRLLAKVNIHFATSKYIDPYATAGIGYKQTNVYSDDINNQNAVNELDNALNIIPVAFRMGIGMRYYFIKNLGITIEGGIGGPLIQAGISGKF